MSLLKISNVHARIEDEGREILKGISLEIKPGEVHAIMGVNGSGRVRLRIFSAAKRDTKLHRAQFSSMEKISLRWIQKCELEWGCSSHFSIR